MSSGRCHIPGPPSLSLALSLIVGDNRFGQNQLGKRAPAGAPSGNPPSWRSYWRVLQLGQFGVFLFLCACSFAVFCPRASGVGADLQYRFYFNHTHSDPLPSPRDSPVQTLPTVVLDGNNRHRMGSLLYIGSAYQLLSRARRLTEL